MRICKVDGCDKEPVGSRDRCEFHRDARRLQQSRDWAKVYQEAAKIRANKRTKEVTNQNKATLIEVRKTLKQPAKAYTVSQFQQAPPEKFARMANRLLAG